MEKKKETKWIQFLGGKNLLFTLFSLLLLGCVIFVFHQISFIFKPIQVVFKTTIGPMILALILYYLFNPIVNFLEKRKIKRIYSVIGIFILIIALIVTGILLVVPILQKQGDSLVKNFPKYMDDLNQMITKLFHSSFLEKPLTNALDSVQRWFDNISSSLGNYYSKAIEGASTVFSTITGFALIVLTAPIITFFLLKDDQKFFSFLLKIIPPSFRKDAKEIGETMNNQVGAYLKGQIIVSIAIGILTFIGFFLIQVPYAGTLAIIVGITAVVPYVGPVIAFIPAAIVAIMVSFGMFIKMCIVWMIVQSLNGHLIQPQIMGKKLVVHPLTIIIVLLVMGDLLGMFGFIFGIPIYAIFKVLVTYLFRKFKQRYNQFYGENGEYEDTEFSKEEYLDE
ncbi:AI-2E family transporter [Enterococcus rivorum]|uniref:AI-2E family transporter n=1 Tax=Enterococcus rivorum TaxID=762845 RepID=A0A1E5KYW4_9ENTE|nr:AI-2E family transporter [Enterococcus rivorum]MBP2099579.1 putative PurR-regulated permease PerM [Enterococcus rivorum]OEH82879.1 AI-2E family transporter [Enterococcus rivorum]